MRDLSTKIVCCITAAAALLCCMAGCRAKKLMAETQEQCGTPTGKVTLKTEKPAETTAASEPQLRQLPQIQQKGSSPQPAASTASVIT